MYVQEIMVQTTDRKVGGVNILRKTFVQDEG